MATVRSTLVAIGDMAQRANPAFAAGAVLVPLVAFAGALFADRLRALTYVHVMAGVLWTGTDVFIGAVVGPTVAGLDPESRAAFFGRFTPKAAFLLPTLATVTIAGGILLAIDLGKFAAPEPWLALFTAATAIPITVGIAVQLDALRDPRALAVVGLAVVGSGAWVGTTVGALAMPNHWILAALAIVAVLSVVGFGVILPGEIRIYRQVVSEDPDADLIGAIGMRNARLGGLQGVLQLTIVGVMVGLRYYPQAF